MARGSAVKEAASWSFTMGLASGVWIVSFDDWAAHRWEGMRPGG